MSWNEVVATLFLSVGAFFALSGGVGILRLPDFYTRLHPAGKNDTLGQFMLLMGLLFLVDWSEGEWVAGAKLVLMGVLVLLTASTATHAITKAAWLDGLEPWGDENARARDQKVSSPQSDRSEASGGGPGA